METTARERWKKKCDELKFITEFIHLNTFYQQTWPQCAATCRWEAVASFISAETVSIILDDMKLKIKTDNICVVQQRIPVQSIVQCCAYSVDTHAHTLEEENKVSVRTIIKSRCLPMAPWLDVLFTSACQQHTNGKICQCDDHAHSTWSFSPTRIPRNSCLRHAKSVTQEKDFSVRGHKWSSLRPISVIDFARPGNVGMHVCRPRSRQTQRFFA